MDVEREEEGKRWKGSVKERWKKERVREHGDSGGQAIQRDIVMRNA